MLLELQAVAGRLDEQKHLAEKDFEKANAEVEVLKSRVDELASPERAEELGRRLSAVEASIALINGQVASLEEAAKAPAAPAEPSAPVTPDSAYEGAFAAFKAKRYGEAREKMRDFLTKNPEHALAGNAAFWIGETYYNEKAYEDAILAYEDVIQKHKGSPKAPSAMLKQAYSFIELGDKRAAKAILNDLVNQFPRDEAAKAAKARLKALE
jgi:tol-pal system protein YbgF